MAISQNYRHVTANHEQYVKQTLSESQKLARLVTLNSSLSGISKTKEWLSYTPPEEIERLRLRRNLDLRFLIHYIENNHDHCSKNSLIDLGHRVGSTTLEYLKHLSDDPRSIIQLYRDLKTIETNPPEQKTLAGKNGPTFIISIPIWGKNPQRGSPKQDLGISCILKWTNHAEITSHRYYEAFTTGFHLKKNLYDKEFCFVPKLTCIDLDAGKILERKNSFSLTPQIRQEVEKSLLQTVLKYQNPEPHFSPEEKVVARIEKVPGKNFPDFAQVDYPSLSPDAKHSLFRRFGKIAFLDFVFGNTDRLFSLDFDDVKIGNYESNLDNLMLQKQDDKIAIFLIDNAIDSKFLKPEFKAAYLSLLQETLSNTNFTSILTESIMTGIHQRMLEVRSSQEFRRDLAEFGKENIEVGLREMKEEFITNLFTKFKAQSGTPLEAHLSGLNSEISLTIKERIETAGRVLSFPPSLSPQLSMSANNYSFSGTETSPSKWLISPQISLMNFFWEIKNHCKGTKEDELFFDMTTPPHSSIETQDPSHLQCLQLFNDIKNCENREIRFQMMQRLEALVLQILQHEIQSRHSPDSPWIAPAPSPIAQSTSVHIDPQAQPLLGSSFPPRNFSIPPPLLIPKIRPQSTS